MATTTDDAPVIREPLTLDNDEKVDEKGNKRDSKDSTSSSNVIVVDWEGPNDPENPKKYVFAFFD
jgi:hypothetical protein